MHAVWLEPLDSAVNELMQTAFRRLSIPVHTHMYLTLFTVFLLCYIIQLVISPTVFSGSGESSENGAKPSANGEDHCESKLLWMSHVSSKQFDCLILLFGCIICRERKHVCC